MAQSSKLCSRLEWQLQDAASYWGTGCLEEQKGIGEMIISFKGYCHQEIPSYQGLIIVTIISHGIIRALHAPHTVTNPKVDIYSFLSSVNMLDTGISQELSQRQLLTVNELLNISYLTFAGNKMILVEKHNCCDFHYFFSSTSSISCFLIVQHFLKSIFHGAFLNIHSLSLHF